MIVSLRRILCTLIAAGGFVSAGVACSSESSGTPMPQGDAGAEGKVVVGFLASATGTYATGGNEIIVATRIAEREINAAGGVLGRQISFAQKDDQSDNNASGGGQILTGILDSFIQDKVVGVVGPLASVQMIQAEAYLAPRQIPFISAGAASPKITSLEPPGPGRWAFRTITSNLGVAVAMFTFGQNDAPSPGTPLASTKAHKCRVPFILYSDDIYGEPIKGKITQLYGKAGTTVGSASVLTDPVDDYSAQVAAIVAAKPDCLFYATYTNVAQKFFPQLKSAIATSSGFPSDFTIIANAALYETDYFASTRVNPSDPTSPSTMEGLTGVAIDSSPPTEEFAAFAKMYREYRQVTTDPGQFASNGFDAAVLMALAIQKAGTTQNRTAVRDALFDVSRAPNGTVIGPATIGAGLAALARGESINYSGASGPVDFDDNGDVKADYFVYGIANGQLQVMHRLKAAQLPE
jgi:branched-chain amino acid transport system substrate-binding protein